MKTAQSKHELIRNESVVGDHHREHAPVTTCPSRPLTFNDAHSPALRLRRPFVSGHSRLSFPLQAKLTINEPGDQYEQEADRVSEQVMRMTAPAARLQRKCGCGGSSNSDCAECSSRPLLVQRQTLSADVTSTAGPPAIVSDVLRASGQPLDQSTRSFMESRFGHDLSHVRVHTDISASEAARAIGARAYTVGPDMVFASGQYAPETQEGGRLLAHELVHTMQQGPASGPRQIQRKDFTPAPGQLGTETGRVTPAGPLSVIDVSIDRTVTCGNVFHLRLQFDPGNCTIVSPMPVRFLHPDDVTKRLPAAQFNALADRFVSVANMRLNGWYSIRITGTAPGCSAPCRDREMPIQVQVSRSSAADAYPITLINDGGRSNARTFHAADMDEWTLWHEAGHVALGISDEYQEAGVACREGSHATEGDWSLMASSSDFQARAVLHPRHFSHILNWFQHEYPSCQVSLPALARSVVLDTILHFEFGAGSFADSAGLYGGASIRAGFPLDVARRFRLLMGARFSALSASQRTAILAGLTLGVDANTNRSAGGFQAGADVTAGVGAMWPSGLGGVSRPWESGGTGARGIVGFEGGAHLGYAGPQLEIGLAGRAGVLAGPGISNPYYMLGLRFGYGW